MYRYLTGAALAAMLAVPVLANHHEEKGPMTRAQAQQEATMRFTEFDTNKDNMVTQEEMKARAEARRSERREERFAHLDANKDGSISKAEFLSPAKRDDGKMGDRKGWRGKHDGEKRGGGGWMLKRQDANNDGRVTRDEAVNAALAKFDKADADRNGTVTPEERKAAYKGRGGDHKHHDGKPAVPPPAK